MGFPVGSVVKNPPIMQEVWVPFLVGKIPWRRAQRPTPVFLPEIPMDRGAWQATIHRVTKSQKRIR